MAATAAGLATRLRPFVDGAYAGLFDGPTTTPTAGHLVVWSLRALAEELKPAAMLLVLDAIWATITHPHDRRRRLITVDEAWLLLAHPAGAQFLLRAAKAGRKHWAGLTVITQDTADVLSTDLGRAVIANAATQILLRQAPQALDQVASTFGLSAGEHGFLASAEPGEGLLTCGEHRAAFSATASPTEDELITTDPRQLAATADAGPDWIVLDHPTHPNDPGRPRGSTDRPIARSAVRTAGRATTPRRSGDRPTPRPGRRAVRDRRGRAARRTDRRRPRVGERARDRPGRDRRRDRRDH